MGAVLVFGIGAQPGALVTWRLDGGQGDGRHALMGRGRIPVNPEGNNGMGMLDGISECWWLSRSCTINWDAWAAIGTVAAVFTAIFAQAIHRRFFLRKEANAVFAVAFYSDVLDARIFVNTLITEFPLNETTEAAEAIHASLKESNETCGRFEKKAARLTKLGDREVDASKWNGVDLKLMLVTTHAIQAARDVVNVGKVLNNGESNRNWDQMIPLFRGTLDRNRAYLLHAEKALDKALVFPADQHEFWRKIDPRRWFGKAK